MIISFTINFQERLVELTSAVQDESSELRTKIESSTQINLSESDVQQLQKYRFTSFFIGIGFQISRTLPRRTWKSFKHCPWQCFSIESYFFVYGIGLILRVVHLPVFPHLNKSFQQNAVILHIGFPLVAFFSSRMNQLAYSLDDLCGKTSQVGSPSSWKFEA